MELPMTDQTALDRRQVLRYAGLGAGIAAVSVGQAALAAPAQAAPTISLRVGVLTTGGSSYAGAGRSLLDGLAVGFGSASATATLVSRAVPGGYDGARALCAELLDAGVDVVVAGVSAPVADALVPLAAERGRCLVAANVGGHLVSRSHPSLLHSSLQHWQSAFAMGQWAATNLGSRLFSVAALPDAGYDGIYAFRRGFESAGGRLVGNAVTHASPADDGVAAAISAARASGADVVVGHHSGSRAADLIRAATSLDATLVVDGLGVEDSSLAAVGPAAVGVRSAASWLAASTTRTSFTKAYRARTGSAPDAFAVLGNDTALLVAEGARRAKGSWGRLVQSLAGASVAGVRGAVAVDEATYATSTPLVVRQVSQTSSGLANTAVATLPRVTGVPPALAGLSPAGTARYLNEYLCS